MHDINSWVISRKYLGRDTHEEYEILALHALSNYNKRASNRCAST